MIEIRLGKPSHGWVDLHIFSGSFEVADAISDVPADFIDQTVQNLTGLLDGEDAPSIFLGLEPDYYVWSFSREGTIFTFEMAKDFDQSPMKSPELLHKTSGSLNEIVRPFFLGISTFYERGFEEPHWPKSDAGNLDALAAALETNTFV